MKRLVRAMLAAAMLPLAVGATLLAARPASAAALTPVTSFGSNPTNLGMYIYVPNNVTARPALLVLVHYCSGSAAGIFNGNGHDYVSGADRYGYIIVLPEATRDGHCFDVSTPAALRRNGGGDSTGIMSMVSYARQRYNVDPGRIVVSGFSSGAMMTNVLAAQYPDVFVAASAFSGVPAGCFATTNGSLWNSQCSGGTVIKTAQQWGDLARAMYPGYTGAYPRMQLWHGTTDTTLAYPNFGEEIKQWTSLRGLGQTATSADHPQSSWTRSRYGATGTQAPVEGVSIANTGHTLPQNGMLAYAISFLALDAASGPSTPSTTTRPPTTTPATTPTTTQPPVTATPSPGAGSCRVSYTVTNQWAGGFGAAVTITNLGAAVSSWQLRWSFTAGQTITQLWNGSFVQAGTQVTVANATYNGSIPGGASTSLGFNGSWTSANPLPTNFTLNGATCG